MIIPRVLLAVLPFLVTLAPASAQNQPPSEVIEQHRPTLEKWLVHRHEVNNGSAHLDFTFVIYDYMHGCSQTGRSYTCEVCYLAGSYVLPSNHRGLTIREGYIGAQNVEFAKYRSDPTGWIAAARDVQFKSADMASQLPGSHPLPVRVRSKFVAQSPKSALIGLRQELKEYCGG